MANQLRALEAELCEKYTLLSNSKCRVSAKKHFVRECDSAIKKIESYFKLNNTKYVINEGSKKIKNIYKIPSTTKKSLEAVMNRITGMKLKIIESRIKKPYIFREIVSCFKSRIKTGDPRYETGEIRVWDTIRGAWISNDIVDGNNDTIRHPESDVNIEANTTDGVEQHDDYVDPPIIEDPILQAEFVEPWHGSFTQATIEGSGCEALTANQDCYNEMIPNASEEEDGDNRTGALCTEPREHQEALKERLAYQLGQIHGVPRNFEEEQKLLHDAREILQIVQPWLRYGLELVTELEILDDNQLIALIKAVVPN